MLDEPSIGLHQRDNARLLSTLRRLRDLGNSVIVVEHDEETIRAADHILDLGPGAGPRGGEIVAQGTIAEVLHAKNSPTADYLSGRAQIAIPRMRVAPRSNQVGDGWLTLATGGATALADPAKARAIFQQKAIRLRLDLGLGRSEAVVWTCDLSPDYVRINSDYTS